MFFFVLSCRIAFALATPLWVKSGDTRPPRTGHKYLELGQPGMTISRRQRKEQKKNASRSMLDNYPLVN